MIGLGTLINVAAILVGGLVGLAVTRQLKPSTQQWIKAAMGAFTVWVAISMMWQGLHGPFGRFLKEFGIMMLSLMLGNFTGRLLRFQSMINRLGKLAKDKLSHAGKESSNRLGEGFVTCSILYCVGPMSILGSMQDGLRGDLKVLGIKSALDGLATMGFAGTFGWGVMLSAIPVAIYQGTLTLLARAFEPAFQQAAIIDAISATGGFMVFCVALVILELKRIALADYLPSLVFAPLLTRWLH